MKVADHQSRLKPQLWWDHRLYMAGLIRWIFLATAPLDPGLWDSSMSLSGLKDHKK